VRHVRLTKPGRNPSAKRRLRSSCRRLLRTGAAHAAIASNLPRRDPSFSRLPSFSSNTNDKISVLHTLGEHIQSSPTHNSDTKQLCIGQNLLETSLILPSAKAPQLKMGDIAVENPANHVPPHKKAAPSAIPTLDNFEGVSTDGGDDYANLKKLQRQLECVTTLNSESFALSWWRGEAVVLTVNTGISSCKKNISRMSKGASYRSERFLTWLCVHFANLCVKELEA
jgi:hypothetical protein